MHACIYLVLRGARGVGWLFSWHFLVLDYILRVHGSFVSRRNVRFAVRGVLSLFPPPPLSIYTDPVPLVGLCFGAGGTSVSSTSPILFAQTPSQMVVCANAPRRCAGSLRISWIMLMWQFVILMRGGLGSPPRGDLY